MLPIFMEYVCMALVALGFLFLVSILLILVLCIKIKVDEIKDRKVSQIMKERYLIWLRDLEHTCGYDFPIMHDVCDHLRKLICETYPGVSSESLKNFLRVKYGPNGNSQAVRAEEPQ